MEYVRAVDVNDLIATEPDVLAKIASVWDKFDDNQLNQLKSLAGNKLNTVIGQIPIKDLTVLSAAVQNKLGFGPKMVQRLNSITAADVASWADEQWNRIPVDNLVSMSQSVLQKVPIAQVDKWSQVCICLHRLAFVFSLLFVLFLSLFPSSRAHNDRAM